MSSNAVVDFVVQISGERVLRATLEQLATKETRRAARKALNSGMSILKRALRAAAPDPETPGHDGKGLRAAINSRHKRNSRSGIVEAKVGIGVGKSKYSKAKGNQQRAPHLHLIALGTQDRFTGAKTQRRAGARTRTRKDGTTYRQGRHAPGTVSIITGNKRMHRGRMYGNPFVSQTATRLDRAVTVHMADIFVEEIEKAAAKLASRGS